jgi:hypothetical protein
MRRKMRMSFAIAFVMFSLRGVVGGDLEVQQKRAKIVNCGACPACCDGDGPVVGHESSRIRCTSYKNGLPETPPKGLRVEEQP